MYVLYINIQTNKQNQELPSTLLYSTLPASFQRT